MTRKGFFQRILAFAGVFAITRLAVGAVTPMTTDDLADAFAAVLRHPYPSCGFMDACAAQQEAIDGDRYEVAMEAYRLSKEYLSWRGIGS